MEKVFFKRAFTEHVLNHYKCYGICLNYNTALRMLDSVESSSSAAIAASLVHRPNDIHIYSNSWGYRTSGMYVSSLHDAIGAVIDYGVRNVSFCCCFSDAFSPVY